MPDLDLTNESFLPLLYSVGAMSAHIPDDGSCLIVYGPHVGVSKGGVVGKVERRGIELVDNCCGSAIAAAAYLQGITEGGAVITTKIQEFTYVACCDCFCNVMNV